MEKARQGKAVLLFVDASHFVMGCDFLGSLWCRMRQRLKTFLGRKRYNVLAALDYVSKKVWTVVNDEYITSTQMCELLQKLAKLIRDRSSIPFLRMRATKNVR